MPDKNTAGGGHGPSITLADLDTILRRETSVIAAEDVWLLMDVVRSAVGSEPNMAGRVADWGITATVGPVTSGKLTEPGELAEGLRAWKVTLTLDGDTFEETCVATHDSAPPTAVDGLYEVRANAIAYREFCDDPEWQALWEPAAQAEMRQHYEATVDWLGEQRFDALIDETAADDNG